MVDSLVALKAVRRGGVFRIVPDQRCRPTPPSVGGRTIYDMNVTFLGQPFMNRGSVGEAFIAKLHALPTGNTWCAVAWAKRSGLGRIASALRGHPGSTELVVGVDEGGATVEGLRLAAELFDRAFVYHDRGRRTFHPKFYVVETADVAHAIVGSGNLTKGGLFENYEAAILLDLDLSVAGDRAVRDELRGYYDELLSRADACKQLDDDLIEALKNDPLIRLKSERSANAARSRMRSGDHASVGSDVSVFGPPQRGLHAAPPLEGPGLDDFDDFDSDNSEGWDVDDETATAEQIAGAAEAREEEGGVAPGVGVASESAGFYKRLSDFDASPTSAPGQIIIPIRFKPFFPNLTVEKDETAAGGTRQSAVTFPVEFCDGSFRHGATGRAILYEPAPTHKRSNDELRFTFRDPEILARLDAGDTLVFERLDDGVTFRVTREEDASRSDRWGWLR